MAYSNVWVTASPPGSQAANTADDEFRKFRLDLEERFEDALITDVVVDPWVLKAALKGNVTGKKIFNHHSDFEFTYITTPPSRTRGYSETQEATTTAWCSIVLPVGITITRFEITASRASSTSTVTLALYRMDSSGLPTPVLVDSTFAVVGNSGQTIGKNLSHAAVAGSVYFYEVTLPDIGIRTHRGMITYDTPAHLNTV